MTTKTMKAVELIKQSKISPIELLSLIKNEKIIWFSQECLPPVNGQSSKSVALKQINRQRLTASFTLNSLLSLYFMRTDIEDFMEKHPEYKPKDAPYISTDGKIPPYLDKENYYFSKELSIAIETWMEIYNTPDALKPGKHKRQISAYLEKHHSDRSSEAKKRIATMINSDNLGGAPKTEH